MSYLLVCVCGDFRRLLEFKTMAQPMMLFILSTRGLLTVTHPNVSNLKSNKNKIRLTFTVYFILYPMIFSNSTVELLI